MGFFTVAKPIITPQEAQKARNELANVHDFNTKELAYFDELVRPYLSDAERYGETKGISPEEGKEIGEQLAKPDPHRVYTVDLSPHKEEAIRQVIDKYLKK